ncbi:MAG: gluconokinase [Opitutales bacterium]
MAGVLVLAVDVGTSATRTALFTEEACLVPSTLAQRKYTLRTSGDGRAELDAEELFTAFEECLEETIEYLRSDEKLRNCPVVAVSTSCFWHSLIGIDHQGRPKTSVITWADTRCNSDALEMRRELDERDIHRRTGCMLRSPFWPAKLRWLKRTQPDLFSSVDRWTSPAEWFQLRFCGNANCSHGIATGTGLYNPTALAWEQELLERCELPESKLSSLSDEPERLSRSCAKRYPELEEAKWFSGIGDGAAGNLGSGATCAGFAAVNVGTSAALRIVKEGKRAQAPFGLFCYRIDSRRYLTGGAVSNAGNLFKWCLKELNVTGDPAELESCLAGRSAPDHGLTVLPFWSGERSLQWRDNVKGMIAGITAHTTALDLLQAVTEAGYYPLADIADQVAEREPEKLKIILSGGITKSPSAVQRLSDVLDRCLYPNDEPEASARGAAVFALEKMGFDVPPFPRCDPIDPRPEVTQRYRKHREKQRALDKACSEEV